MLNPGYLAQTALAFLAIATTAYPLPTALPGENVSLDVGGKSVELPRKVRLPELAAKEVCWKATGVRKKRVLVTNVSVYRLDRYESCDGKAFPRVLRLVFLRDVGSEKIRDSFRDALAANAVPVGDDSLLGKLLSDWKQDLKEDSSLWIIADKKDSTERLALATDSTEIKTESGDAASQFWKIWFGKPADSGLETLQSQINIP